MKMNEYQEKAMQTCMESSNNLTYAIYGMLGEMGELLEKVVGLGEKRLIKELLDCGTFAKHVRKGIVPELDLSIDDKKGFSLELGDQQWFTALSARLCGTDLSTIGEMNLDKLGSRKERGKIEGDGDYR